MTQLAPSALARRIAASQWPDVQTSHKITKGVYDFTCAGHGGIVAIIDATPEGMIPAAAIAAGEREGVVVEYVVYRSGRRTKLALSEGVDSTKWASWVQYAEQVGAVVQRGKAWIGEEDCAWSTLVASSNGMLKAWVESRRGLYESFEEWAAKYGTTYPREVAERWHPNFIADLDGALAAV